MGTKESLKAFMRVDGMGRVVPSTLVYRKKKPVIGKWIEVEPNTCCSTTTLSD